VCLFISIHFEKLKPKSRLSRSPPKCPKAEAERSAFEAARAEEAAREAARRDEEARRAALVKAEADDIAARKKVHSNCVCAI